MSLTSGQMPTKLSHIQPDLSTGIQANFLTVNVQPSASEGFSKGVQGSPKGGPTPGAIVLGPEQVDQGSTPVALAGGGDVGQKGDGLARIHSDLRAITLDARWAKQMQSKARHRNTPFVISVLEIAGKVNRIPIVALPSRLSSRLCDGQLLSYHQNHLSHHRE
jgi:hypothetical protein